MLPAAAAYFDVLRCRHAPIFRCRRHAAAVKMLDAAATMLRRADDADADDADVAAA